MPESLSTANSLLLLRVPPSALVRFLLGPTALSLASAALVCPLCLMIGSCKVPYGIVEVKREKKIQKK